MIMIIMLIRHLICYTMIIIYISIMIMVYIPWSWYVNKTPDLLHMMIVIYISWSWYVNQTPDLFNHDHHNIYRLNHCTTNISGCEMQWHPLGEHRYMLEQRKEDLWGGKFLIRDRYSLPSGSSWCWIWVGRLQVNIWTLIWAIFYPN